ncbi:Uncharacterized protein GBIM_02048 [Gryllus bimaculatus]|nr:Uncharacterized protein GBIM_02048 [Gryllus bimaculatus]
MLWDRCRFSTIHTLYLLLEYINVLYCAYGNLYAIISQYIAEFEVGLIKKTVEEMIQYEEAFKYLNTKFPLLSDSKIKDGILVGPQFQEQRKALLLKPVYILAYLRASCLGYVCLVKELRTKLLDRIVEVRRSVTQICRQSWSRRARSSRPPPPEPRPPRRSSPRLLLRTGSEC